MKRDVEIFRKILLQLEARPNGEVDQIQPIEGVSESDLHGHVDLLIDGGHIKAIDETPFGSQFNLSLIERITFEGHEFLDSIRHQGFISELKAKAADEGSSLPMTVIKELGLQYLRKKTGLDK